MTAIKAIPVPVAEREMERAIAENRKNYVVSEAHNEVHCRADARYGAITADALLRGQRYRNDEAEVGKALAMVAGYLHDTKRGVTETSRHGKAGAEHFLQWYRGLPEEERGDPRAAQTVYDAIATHEGSFADAYEQFGPAVDINKTFKEILPAVVAHSLVTGDKCMEASGHRVIDRRSFFVGKERTEDGDLADIFIYPDESPKSVLGETQVRLYKRNPIDTYPDWLKDFAQQWHGIQYWFYRGLLESQEMSEAEAAQFMKEKKFPKATQGLVEQVQAEQHLSGRHFDPEEYPVLAEEIEKINDLSPNDLARLGEGTNAIVTYIARDSERDALEGLESYWNSNERNKFGDWFARGIQDYRNDRECLGEQLGESVKGNVRKIFLDQICGWLSLGKKT